MERDRWWRIKGEAGDVEEAEALPEIYISEDPVGDGVR
jgi:hypothetical protein